MAKKKRPPAASPAAIEISGLTKAYGDLVALAPLHLSIATGSLTALIGHNGSGKSTLLKLLAGLLDPTDGSVAVAGNEAGSVEARAALSYLSDDPVLYDDLSVREHLEYLLPLHGVDAWSDATDALAERLGLTERLDELPSRFSRGLRQKTALLIGLSRPFEVLLIDEPFVGLDQSGRLGLLGHLDEVHAAGRTIVVATHDLDLVERVDRCVALQNGHLFHDGPAARTDVSRLAG